MISTKSFERTKLFHIFRLLDIFFRKEFCMKIKAQNSLTSLLVNFYIAIARRSHIVVRTLFFGHCHTNSAYICILYLAGERIFLSSMSAFMEKSFEIK